MRSRVTWSLAAAMSTIVLCTGALAGDGDWGKGKSGCVDGWCQPTSNLYVGFEAAALKPHMGALGFSGLGQPATQVTPEYDFTLSPRLWLGWDNAEGMGVRATYWQIDTAAQQFIGNTPALGPIPAVTGLTIGTGLEAHALDVEFTQKACGMVDLEFTGGFRYGKMRTDLSAGGTAGATPFFGGVGADFEGIGPTLGLNFHRQVGSRGLAFVGGFQASWLYGNTDAYATDDLANVFDLVISSQDHMMQVYEAKLGVEWARQLRGGNLLTLGLLWEAQAWNWAPVAGLVSQDIGLTGPTFTLAITH